MKNQSDTHLLAKVSDDSYPLDDFKKIHIFNKKQNKFAEKPNNIKKSIKGKMK